jgi:hypothetical protein
MAAWICEDPYDRLFGLAVRDSLGGTLERHAHTLGRDGVCRGQGATGVGV